MLLQKRSRRLTIDKQVKPCISLIAAQNLTICREKTNKQTNKETNKQQ